ncbi:MAG: YfcE family phosphodiesterase, partial [Bacteroidales bacterium]|nr:YfcE family phosphodiesterase [Bacteroidales bacterium]
LLHLNPGAAGISGLHKVITMMRFDIDGKEIKNLEIFEKTRATR